MRILPAQAFLQTDKTLIADHKVVDQFDIEMLSCCDQLLGYGYVFRGGSWIAAGVIVANNDSRAVTYDCGTVDIC